MGKKADAKTGQAALRRAAAMKKKIPSRNLSKAARTARRSNEPPDGFGETPLMADSRDEELKQLRIVIRGLNERVTDLVGQVERLSQSRMIHPDELAAIAAERQSFAAMNEEFMALGLFFRRNFERQIERGGHNNRKLSEIVIDYLSQLPMLKQKPKGVTVKRRAQ